MENNIDIFIERIITIKKLFLNKKIQVDDAVNRILSVLNDYRNRDLPVLSEEDFVNDNVQLLVNKQKQIDRKINYFNKILILQELGVYFSDEELSFILNKPL